MVLLRILLSEVATLLPNNWRLLGSLVTCDGEVPVWSLIVYGIIWVEILRRSLVMLPVVAFGRLHIQVSRFCAPCLNLRSLWMLILNGYVKCMVWLLGCHLLSRRICYDSWHISLAIFCCFLHVLVVTASHFILFSCALTQSFCHGHLLFMTRTLLLLRLLYSFLTFLLILLSSFLGTLRGNSPKFFYKYLLIVVHYTIYSLFHYGFLAGSLRRFNLGFHPVHLWIRLCGNFAIRAQLGEEWMFWWTVGLIQISALLGFYLKTFLPRLCLMWLIITLGLYNCRLWVRAWHN